MRGRPTAFFAIGILTLAIVAEAGIRLGGLVDQPLFDADATIGYIPTANQQGSFLNRNDWVINEKHMGADSFVPGIEGNVLLVGDSIVWGGNPYAREHRLGPQLQRLISPVKVWPISAGSWGLQNEMAYLRKHPEVVASVDTIMFVINSGDLDRPSSWGCTLTHPREKPVLAAWFIARKYLLHSPCEGTPPELAVERVAPLPLLGEFMAAYGKKRVVVIFYPDLKQSADPLLRNSELETMKPLFSDVGVREFISVGDDARWKADAGLYKDGIHPSIIGTGVLAQIIADRLQHRGAD